LRFGWDKELIWGGFRYLPLLIDKLEKIVEEAGMASQSIVTRMTGDFGVFSALSWSWLTGFVVKVVRMDVLDLGTLRLH